MSQKSCLQTEPPEVSPVLNTVFNQISVAVLIEFFVPQMRHLFEGGTYLKIGCDKEKKMLKTDYLHKSLEKGRENLGLLCRQSSMAKFNRTMYGKNSG